MNDVGCRCTSVAGKKGWVASADLDVWVHAECGQPSSTVLQGERMRTDINLMRYGSHHNELHETSVLVSSSDFAWIAEYVWSPEVVIGSESGRKARVWIHRDHVASSSTG